MTRIVRLAIPWYFAATVVAACGSTGDNNSTNDGGSEEGNAGTGNGSGSGASGSGGGSGSSGGNSGSGSGSANSGSSGATSGSSSGSAGSGDASAGSGADGGGSIVACDSGGPLTLQSFWTLPSTATPSAITADAQGNVYVAGIYNGSIAFGTKSFVGPTNPGTGDMFLVKYDHTGAVVYANSYGTATGVYDPPVLAVDASGNAYLGGAFSQTLNMGGSSTAITALSLDAFAAKISSTGVTQWAKRFGYNEGPYAVLSIAVGPDGEPVFAGTATGTIVLGTTTWTAPVLPGSQPFILKLNPSDGSVVWSNASGGNIVSGEDIWVAVDASNRVFLAARVQSGGGRWGIEPEAGASTFATLRAGFHAADGTIEWGQFDYGAFPTAAAVDSEGRFAVLENAFDHVNVGGVNAFGSASSGSGSIMMLFSPTDGTLLSGIPVTSTFPWGATVDANGNTLMTGTYWPKSSPLPVGGLSLPGGNVSDQPLFVAGFDGASHAVSVATLGATNSAQPLGIAVDPLYGHVYVPFTLATGFTSSVGAVAAGTSIVVFGPDPCDDGAGPVGSSTGDPSNHGDLPADGGSPYVAPDAGPCPATAGAAVSGAACPAARACGYGTECCSCSPSACGAAATTWTCVTISNAKACPSSPPTPGTSCPTVNEQCDYCQISGHLVATCTAGGWETGNTQVVCY